MTLPWMYVMFGFCIVALALLGRVGRMLWPAKDAEPQEKPEGIRGNQQNLEYHKARVLKEYPDASCFYVKTSWPGQGFSWKWIITTHQTSSRTFASGATEEWCWERAAINIAFARMQKALVIAVSELPESDAKAECMAALVYINP